MPRREGCHQRHAAGQGIEQAQAQAGGHQHQVGHGQALLLAQAVHGAEQVHAFVAAHTLAQPSGFGPIASDQQLKARHGHAQLRSGGQQQLKPTACGQGAEEQTHWPPAGRSTQPERPPSIGQAALPQSIHSLRQACGVHGVVHGADALRRAAQVLKHIR